MRGGRVLICLSCGVANAARTNANPKLSSTSAENLAPSRGESRHPQHTPNVRCGSSGGSGGDDCKGDGFPPLRLSVSRRSLSAVGAGLIALLSRVRCAVTMMALLAAASAQEVEGARPVGVTVPLTPDGLQYTADVTVSDANFTSTAALVVVSTLSLVAFPACENDTAASNDEEDEDGNGNGDGTCIPFEEIGERVEWTCDTWTVDGGTVSVDPDDPALSDYMPFVDNQDVSLSTDVSGVGGVFATFNTTASGDSVTLDGWDGAAGILGLAPFPRKSCVVEETGVLGFPSVFSSMDGADFAFALDLGNESYNSTLEVGGYSGYSSESMGSIQWGESQTATSPSSWGFSAFDLTVCGRSMMSNITAFWPGVISTGSACLGLPEEFFDSLMAWLPVKDTCLSEADEIGAMCSLAAEDAAKELPSLSFRLSQHGSEIFIPLSSLLLDPEGEEPETDLDGTTAEGSSGDGSGDRRLCVTRQPSIRESGWLFQLPSQQPLVSLGTLALRSLYTIVDASGGRVGLAQKADDASLRETGDDLSCQAAAVCVGMESFRESDNTCEAPSCSSYYLTVLNEENMTCESTGIMKILAWVFGIFFGVTEMAGHFLRAYYGSTGIGLRGHQQHQGWEFHTGRLLEACLAKVTRTTGRTPHERED